MHIRQALLAEALRPGTASQLGVFIGQMFASYLSVKLDAGTLRKTIAAYVAQVQIFPEWAVERACQNCANRDSPFPVSGGELRAECERHTKPIHDEAGDLRNILNGEVYHERSAGERERIRQGFESLLKELRDTNAMQKQPRVRGIGHKEGFGLSEEALRKFGARRQSAAE